MKVVVDSGIPFIRDRFEPSVEVVYMSGADIDAKAVADADALIIRTRTKCNENLLKNSKVKVVATATIGTDHIDIPRCQKMGIKVFSAPGCNAPGVAQYVFASLFRLGFDPAKDTLGIIGYGNVGSTVGEWAREMGIKFLVNDPPKQTDGNSKILFTDLDSLLKESNAVTIHVPLTSSGPYPTYHLIDHRNLMLMKSGGILINSSRGGVVDENTLLPKLTEGYLKGVIDVWENEPDINSHLLKVANIATPHIAGYSFEGKKRGTRMALEAVANELGLKVDLKGLECKPTPGLKITRQLIENSYNPEKDSRNLKADPKKFEELRNNYNYRHEPLFTD